MLHFCKKVSRLRWSCRRFVSCYTHPAKRHNRLVLPLAFYDKASLSLKNLSCSSVDVNRRYHSLTWHKHLNECNGDLSRTKLVDRANTQLLHMVVDALY